MPFRLGRNYTFAISYTWALLSIKYNLRDSIRFKSLAFTLPYIFCPSSVFNAGVDGTLTNYEPLRILEQYFII